MSNATTETPDTEPVIIMNRLYEAPRDLVWEAFTDPKHVARWWGGSGATNPVCEMDVRPGGQWRHLMRFPDGREVLMNFVFVEVSKPRKLVWQSADDAGCGTERPGDILFTVTLDALGAERTAWKLVARFRSAKDRETALAMGFTRTIETSNEHLVQLLKTLQGQQPR